ncbi:MAG: pseudouridine synthase [Acidobacteriota bacterium]|nr:pseudouridine synthase [Acidobacteriota bacterium]
MSLNDGFDYIEHLGRDADGSTLLAYLTRRYPHSSADTWGARIETGRVLLDSSPAGRDTVLRRGQTLVWKRPPWREPEAPTSFDVLLEDEDVLAVAKPAGLPTLPGGGFLQNTLLHLVRERFPGTAPLHRLGRWTSGIVLFARTAGAHSELSRQWADRRVGKLYRALASGDPAHDTFSIDTPIGPVPHPLLGSVHAACETGKPASSHVTVVERRDGEFLCDVRITTGRPHQIRIHLAAVRHPLVRDPLYVTGGVPPADCRALPGDPGYALHAAELVFGHPSTAEQVVLRCSPPPLLQITEGAKRL